jgi:hypothetical protein
LLDSRLRRGRDADAIADRSEQKLRPLSVALAGLLILGIAGLGLWNLWPDLVQRIRPRDGPGAVVATRDGAAVARRPRVAAGTEEEKAASSSGDATHYYVHVYDASRHLIAGNPDLIFPGQIFDQPDPPPDAAQ